jgi:hypothetical protein
MISRFITHIRRPFNFNSIQYTMLGRWTREPVFQSICIKVDQANEDHCGCCNVIEIAKTNNDEHEMDEETLKFYCQ